MNYSVNYAGFIDLADATTKNTPEFPTNATENCKPAVAIQLYKDKNINDFMNGVVISNPIKNQRG